jgi:hypothetical protein
MDANSRADLDALIDQLEAEERALSAVRRQLHDRIDVFEGDKLAERERELSDRRRELHGQIDVLRAERDGDLPER